MRADYPRRIEYRCNSLIKKENSIRNPGAASTTMAAAVLRALYHWRWPIGFVCPNCGHDRGCQLTTHKLQQCYRCNRQTSITAGTIFEATKLPLTVWFQGIYRGTANPSSCPDPGPAATVIGRLVSSRSEAPADCRRGAPEPGRTEAALRWAGLLLSGRTEADAGRRIGRTRSGAGDGGLRHDFTRHSHASLDLSELTQKLG